MFQKKQNIVEEKRNEVERLLKECSSLSTDEILEKYETTLEGYDEIIAEEKLEEYGPNIIDIQNETSLLERLKDSIINPFNIVLIVVAIVNCITDIIIEGKPGYETLTLILATVFISAIISFREQEKSNKAAKKLQKLIVNKVDVIRNDLNQVIDIENIVPGEIVKLSSGDMLPGDVRFLQTKDLFIDQAALTGESNPVEKFDCKKGDDDLTSLSNIGFMGTNVISGTGIAIVLTTGEETYFGSMAKSLYTTTDKSSFEKGIDSVSRLLIRFMLVMVPIIFLVNIFTKESWIESLLFGITIAVGLTPEMLPVIMTSTLAKGAVSMSKKKTIVKRLGTIQAFGEMDILCTDKTGTLTEDEIILERYMDAVRERGPKNSKACFLKQLFPDRT